jgi:putative ABC transport system permease protein
VLAMTGAWYSLSFWGVVIAVLGIGVLVVGLYPALLLSSFNPALVLKGKFYTSQTGILLRKGLVVFQYVLSIFLIAGTIAIYSQLSFMQQTDPGYNKEQVLVVRAAAIYDSSYLSQIDYFKNEVLTIPAVERVTVSGDIPGQQMTGRNLIRLAADEQGKGLITYQFAIDHDFIGTFRMSLVAGRSFNENDTFIFTSRERALFTTDGFLISGMNKVIINQYLAERLGFTNPEDAISQLVKVKVGGGEYGAEVIGVLKNHHQVSLRENFEPIVYYFPRADSWKYFSMRLNTNELGQTITKVRDLYSDSFPGNGFEYFFLDDHFNNQYKNDQQFATIFGILTVLAIMIACLGLLGLSVFTVTQRSKEIGIRKVLGASISSILVLFSSDSAKLLGVSWIISIPLIYFAVDHWLKNFAFHIGIGWPMFLAPPLVLLAISVVTIMIICLRAAILSPVVSLRHE